MRREDYLEETGDEATFWAIFHILEGYIVVGLSLSKFSVCFLPP